MTGSLKCPRIVVVGCGAAALEFCLPVLKRRSGFRNRVVLVDKSPDQARRTAEQFGIEQWCTDYAKLPCDVDAAMITTPHHLHAEQACAFLEQGKPVFVEKPLGVTSAEVDTLLSMAHANDVTLMVNNYRRLFPAYQRVHDLLRAGELGRVRRITIDDGTRFAWASVSAFYMRDLRARGVFLDRGAHTIDVLCWWLGGTPRVVSAASDAQGGIEAVMHVELEHDGVPIELAFSRLQRLANRYEIECEHGMIRGRLFDFNRIEVVREERTKQLKCGASGSYADWAWKLVENFVDVVCGTAAPLFVARDVAPSLTVIEQAYDVVVPFEMPWYTQDPNIATLLRLETAGQTGAATDCRASGSNAAESAIEE